MCNNIGDSGYHFVDYLVDRITWKEPTKYAVKNMEGPMFLFANKSFFSIDIKVI
jgi:hypothetical protein